MISPNTPGRDLNTHNRPDLDGQTPQNRLRIRTEHQGPCVVIGVAGEIDIATADRLGTIAVLAATPPSVVIDLGEVEFCRDAITAAG
ncbi:STAS domain-containing protein [Actinomadura sp. DC4]|uniref:STAS domain-containing protein n=1 Tax=Actinomadura sp. DC4 TaxID=3055069 RepID=UPI0025AFBFE5|nr:STAS domain-containing protein [Actinomadura sp. DC4]MDN3354475.1 STAS domain-containing protein [Actinomadura sp. DC4]